MAHITAEPARDYLSPGQIELLLKPIHPQRVLSLKNMAYVAGHDIRAELNRVFGFCRWSEQILEQELVSETETKTSAGKPAWNIIYRTRVRLTVHAPDGSMLTFYDGSHVGENTQPSKGEAHGVALTASETYALRRAAINLGDQFGLSLYNKGSLEPIVRWTLVGDLPANTDDVAQVEEEEQTGDGSSVFEQMGGTITNPGTPVTSPARKKKTPVSTVTTPQGLAFEAGSASTTDALRETWKRAGELGFLKTEIKVTITDDNGEIVSERKLLLQDYLLERSNDLSFPDGAQGAEGSGNAGGGTK